MFRIATRALQHQTIFKIFDAGGDLLSHTLPGAVPSAQTGLASGFGKGPGVTPSQKPPTNTYRKHTPTPPQQDDWCAVSSQTLHSRRENLQSICATHAHHQQQCDSRYLRIYFARSPNSTHQPKHVGIVLNRLGPLVPVTSTLYSASRSGLSTP